jgi:aminopeptidase N
VFLSSYVFVPPAQRPTTLHADFAHVLFDRLMVRHETAHQWWGDSVYWTTYRDQWLSEALANYSAMLSFESEHPEDVQTVLRYYRTELAEKSPEKRPNREAGPVTLGQRLNSSIFPNGYDLIAYGRGTWLIHMLRELLRDPNATGPGADDLFFSVLRNLQRDLGGKQMSTLDVQRAFERVLPKSLYYEKKPSLDWFFDGWVNGTAQPHYEIKTGRAERRASDVRISGNLLQKDAPEELITAVPIYAELGKGELRFVTRVFADGPETSFVLKAPAGTRRLVADPYGTILTAP